MKKENLKKASKEVLFLMCCTKGLIKGDTSWYVMDGYSKKDLIAMLEGEVA